MADVVDVNPEVTYVDNATKALPTSNGKSSGDQASKDNRIFSEEQESSILGWFVYSYVSDLVSLAQNKTVAVADLLLLTKEDRAEEVAKVFSEAYEKKATEVKARDGAIAMMEPKQQLEVLNYAMQEVAGTKFIVAGIIKAFNSTAQFAYPVCVAQILSYIEDPASGSFGAALTWAFILAFCSFAKAILENLYYHLAYRVGWQLRSALSSAVFQKSLRLSTAAMQTKTVGELVNLMQIDSSKVEQFAGNFHVLWDGLFQITAYLVILWTQIGWSSLIGLVTMILAMPVQGVLFFWMFKNDKAMVLHTDERVKVTNEALIGIQAVKFYAWEDSMVDKINNIRQLETKRLETNAYLRGATRAYMGAVPGITSVISFLFYAYFGNGTIKASILFAALTTFNQLRFPLLFYPLSIQQYLTFKVSTRRLAEYFSMSEIKSDDIKPSPDGDGSVALDGVDFAWFDPVTKSKVFDKEEHAEGETNDDEQAKNNGQKTDIAEEQETKGSFKLSKGSKNKDKKKIFFSMKGVSLKVQKGKIVAVVGPVASGKSCLLNAFLGEVFYSKGHLERSGTVSYASQTSWIMNATIKDNILFGQDYDRIRYHAVLDACQLRHDLAVLEHGDATMIGERGINLSGGQKQRVSIARAAYARADICILDDPLSALDPEVGNAVFDECIDGLLGESTRIFATNQLHLLPKCDHIVVLGHETGEDSQLNISEGKILEQGSYDELLSNGKAFAKLMEEVGLGVEQEEEEEKGEDEDRSKSRTESSSAEADEMMTREEMAVGAVTVSTYLKYIEAGGGNLYFMLIFAFFLLTSSAQLIGQLFVALWSNDATYQNQSLEWYLGMYALLQVLTGVLVFTRSYLLAHFGITASLKVHKDLLESVFAAPMSWFDTTPIGRVISRFSKDIFNIDTELTNFLDFAIFMVLSVLMTMVMITAITPWFAVAAIFVMAFYFWTMNYFRKIYIQAKRLDSVTRSPIYALFGETLGGLSTIRAYKRSSAFMKDNVEKIDTNMRAWYLLKVADRWLGVRLESCGAVLVLFASIFAVVAVAYPAESGVAISGGIAGMSLSTITGITGMLNWAVRSLANLENGMNSMERVLFYSEKLPAEAPARSENPPDETWPANGAIEIKSLKMRYREGLPLVLKNLSVSIAAGERVGIVGRTGSGKSSLMLCLMRIVEPLLGGSSPESNRRSGPIVIDGVDTMKIGLSELRSKVGIIPQTPTLFSGTIRTNLDPFGKHDDPTLWKVLEQCNLKEAIMAKAGKLDAEVAEFGSNLSQGQRQLLCLGRPLLQKAQVLLLDEATSSVDLATDNLIQKTIREAFTTCTILTIAHRIATIIDSDKVLVLEKGEVKEFNTPSALLADAKSEFSAIVRELGPEQEAQLRALAGGATAGATAAGVAAAATPPGAAPAANASSGVISKEEEEKNDSS